MKYVIGIDPGSTKGHGVSTYCDGKLIDLRMCELMELHEYLLGITPNGLVVVHIEDVYSQKGVWHGQGQNKKAFAKTSQNVGLCKWSQIEVERMCKHIGVEVIRHKVSSVWKKERPVFEKFTKWKGQSNEDTRSAAYFGFLGL